MSGYLQVGFCRVAMMCVLMAVAVSAAAVTPDVRLPDWNKTQFRLRSWDVEGKKLTLSVRIQALAVPLRDLSIKAYLPDTFSGMVSTYSKDRLEKGHTWQQDLILTCPQSYEGWMNIAVHALPEGKGMQQVIAKDSALGPAMKAILTSEAQNLREPIFIGDTRPLYLDKNIALFSTPHLVLRPLWKAGTRDLHLWMPPESIGTGFLRETFRLLRQSLQKRQEEGALKTLALLLKRLPETGALEIALPGKEGTLQFPVAVVRQGLVANQQTILAWQQRTKGAAVLSRHLQQAQPGFTTAFLWANLGVLLAEQGQMAQAKEAWQQALRLEEAWPLVKGWLQDGGGR